MAKNVNKTNANTAVNKEETTMTTTPKEKAVTKAKKEKETKTVNKKGKEVITPEIPKKYLDSKKLINNLWLYFKKHPAVYLPECLHLLYYLRLPH